MGKDSKSRLLDVVDGMVGKKIMVVGDLGIDEYVDGAVKRISPEAPVPVLEVREENYCIGLSGNVSQNIVSLRAEPILVGVVGADEAAEKLKQLLSKQGVSSESLIVDSSRPTTRKLRVMTGQHHIVRVDYEKKRLIDATVEEQVLQQASSKMKEADALIIQDYAKGVLTERLVQKLIERAHSEKIAVFVDPHRTSPLKIYRGADVFKPNFDEALALSGWNLDSLHKDSDYIEKIGQELREGVEAKHIVMTRGKDGMSLFSKGRETTNVPTVAKKVYDVTGAGDTVIAALAGASSAGATMEEACRIANFAAGIVVAEIGCVACSATDLKTAVKSAI